MTILFIQHWQLPESRDNLSVSTFLMNIQGDRPVIVCCARHQIWTWEDGEDYFQDKAKKRFDERQEVKLSQSVMSHTTLKWAQVHKLSIVCSLCKCYDYVICVTSIAPLFAMWLIARKLKLLSHFKIIIWDPQSKVVCVQQCAHSLPTGLMIHVAMSTASLCFVV